MKMVSMTDSDAKGKTGNGSSAVPVVDLSDDSNSGSNANVPIGGKPSAGAGRKRKADFLNRQSDLVLILWLSRNP